jgi:AcrR family transcriptional regulator
MPKKPDAQLEARILNAAFKLWLDGGEQALTMRAVAKAAKTTTPTLYERFRDKNTLMRTLRARAQQDLYDAVEPSKSIAEAFRIAIDFTVTHGHEYELIGEDWAARLSRKEPTPSFDLMKQRLAEQLGGSAADHSQLALAIVSLYHGASMLLLGGSLDPRLASAIKEACIAATDTLVNSAQRSHN